MLGRDFEDEVWTRFVFELVIWPNRLLWKDELNPRVRCAFGNVFDGMTFIRTLDSQFSWIFDIFEKVAMETSQYALPKSYDDMRAEKTTFSRLSLVRGFLWHPSTGQNQAQPLLCSIRPYWVLKAFSHLARRQANFFCSPFLSNLSEKKSCWLYLSIQIWCVSRLDEGIGRVKWIMEISVFLKVNIMLKPPLT